MQQVSKHCLCSCAIWLLHYKALGKYLILMKLITVGDIRINESVSKLVQFVIQELSVISVRIVWKFLCVINSSFLLKGKIHAS